MTVARIHPSAVVHPAAGLGADVEVGPFCVVHAGVRVGDRCRLLSHVVLDGPAAIGADNVFFPFAAIGGRTQDLKYAGEPTFLEIGDGNTFRESVTVHRGTSPGGVTRIGSRGNFLAYSHIAHDCMVGDDVIFSNNGTVAGHVEVGARAIIGGLTAVHQFCRIGTLAITGGCTKIVQDVPPFFIADGNPAEVRGVNVVGLERAGFGPETARALREAYRIVYRSNLNTAQAVERLTAELGEWPEVRALVGFITTSKRGIVR